jgi:alginate O-acetyltransferase complex protein AlgI
LIALLISLSLQIYFDFSGYSDMAIGVSQTLGYSVPENFDNPYFAKDIGDFWRRWHMSLSSWIRDYLYIPLGGNKVSIARRIANGGIAMFICGLWHGAALNFGIWGLWHGFLLGLNVAVQQILLRRWPAIGQNPLWKLSYRGFTLAAVAAGWLIFFYDVPTALKLIRDSRGVFW